MMGIKAFLVLLCLCSTILSFHPTAGFPRSSSTDSDSQEDNDYDDTQQVQQRGEDDDDLQEIQKLRFNPNPIQQVQVVHDPNDICLLGRQTGPCKAYLSRYFFNSASKKCERFIYGGCGGNKNNFLDLGECETGCSRHLIRPEAVGNEIAGETCELPAVRNGSETQCLAMIPKWTFDAKQGKCVRFMYGGCGATKNNFENKYACERVCKDYKKKPDGFVQGQHTGETGTTVTISNLRKTPKCEQEMESGPCYGMMKRYFFSKEKNRCEKFIYGGCGGNENNFESGEDCIRACGGDTPSDDEACSLIDCPWNLYSHYQTLGCKPIYDGQSCCPTRYDCPDANLTISKVWVAPTCTYKGKSYAVGESVLEASRASSCRTSCICYGFGGKPRINCANIECPENLGALPPEKQSCTKLYRKDACCAHDFYCANETTTTNQEGENGQQIVMPILPPPEKCNFEGAEYVVGERFYPKNGQCMTCTCLKGFNGTLSEDYCRKIDCGLEIYYSSQLERGCVPVYFKDKGGQDSCCPIGWQCPDENTVVQQQTQPSIQPRSPPMIISTRVEVQRPESNYQLAASINSTVCFLPAETGPCRSIRPRFHYNNGTRKCESFTYGGCKGNANNFILKSDCQTVCENNTEIAEAVPQTKKSPVARSGTGFIQPKSFYLNEVDPCVLPVKMGNCRAFFPRYYFSPESNVCKYFVYGGCGGNPNNFLSMESCEATCQNKIPVESLRMSEAAKNASKSSSGIIFNDEEENEEDERPRPRVIDITPSNGNQNSDSSDSEEFDAEFVCNLKPVTGPCRAHKPRYYYDPEVKYCKRFTYGGCAGNANNFEKLKECDFRCGPSKGVGLPGAISPKWRVGNVPQNSIEGANNANQETEMCKLPPKIGTCFAKLQLFYYDTMSATCKNFTYGGCFGNGNRFPTLEACEQTCKIPLAAQQSVGGIVAGATRWRSSDANIPIIPNQREEDLTSRSGVPIINNQNTRVEDDRAHCELEPQPGNCKGSHLRYFWAKQSERCLPFFYSGCRGNRNNFGSESDCLSSCSPDPTIEQMTQQGILTCSFGNETIPLGGTLGGQTTTTTESSEPPCGVPVCQCLTPPSLTCFQTACPPPPVNLDLCPTPSCGPNCKPGVRPDNGCPTCDCEERRTEWDVQLVRQPEFTVKKVNVKS